MEVSGAVLRPLPCLSGAGFDTHSLQPSLSCQSIDAGKRFSGELRLLGSRDSKVFVKPRKYSGVSNSFFSNDGHLQYYVSPRSGGKKEKEKEKEKEKGKSSEMKAIKKKLKLVRGLSKDLSMFSGMGFGLNSEDGLIEEVKEKLVSEAAEVLLAQLQHLRAEEKEMKRKRKEEKAKLKADRMKAMGDCKGSSSSSSESSDSECGEVIDMSQLRKESLAETKVDPQQETDAMLTSPSLLIHEKSIVGVEEIEDRSIVNCRQECCHGGESSCSSASTINNNDQSNVVVGTSAQRIEICMGGKCKKSGAAALLEEFERRIGVEGAVVGCKCMGKCRDGPNVRVLNRCDAAEGVDTSVRTPANPLCIGVGLEDVSSILTNFFGEESRDFGLMATS